MPLTCSPHLHICSIMFTCPSLGSEEEEASLGEILDRVLVHHNTNNTTPLSDLQELSAYLSASASLSRQSPFPTAFCSGSEYHSVVLHKHGYWVCLKYRSAHSHHVALAQRLVQHVDDIVALFLGDLSGVIQGDLEHLGYLQGRFGLV